MLPRHAIHPKQTSRTLTSIGNGAQRGHPRTLLQAVSLAQIRRCFSTILQYSTLPIDRPKVKTLYRTFLRHAIRLPLDDEWRGRVVHEVRRSFKHKIGFRGAEILRKELIAAYEVRLLSQLMAKADDTARMRRSFVVLQKIPLLRNQTRTCPRSSTPLNEYTNAAQR